MRRWHAALIGGALMVTLLVAFWLRVENLRDFPPGISNDEAVNLIDAVHIAQTGNYPLYQDRGRPEPLFRLMQAAGAAAYGYDVWLFRLTSAFVGVLSVAAAYWAAREGLHEVASPWRAIAALSAAVVLTVAIGHITVTRSTYRAVPQPLWTFLAFGFLMRGLRTLRWRDFTLSGFFVALGLYTYTAAFMVPLAFFPLGGMLIITRWRTLRRWLPRFVSTGLVTALLMFPVLLLLLQTPEAVIGRAAAVSASDLTLSERLEQMAMQLFERGDENPQYNVALAPVIAPAVAPLLLLGLGALVLRIRQPASIFLAALFVLSLIPALFTDEISHGLRIVGVFVAFPLIVAAGVASVLVILARLPVKTGAWLMLSLGGLMLLLAVEAPRARAVYAHYWTNADEYQRWTIYNQRLTHSEWFFRTDHRAIAEWIAEQDEPLLMPLDGLVMPSERVWLLRDYPKVTTAPPDFTLPEKTRLVIPWALERDGLLDEARHYAWLHEGVITLLPPLTEAVQQRLTSDISENQAIPSTGNFPTLGYARWVPDDFALRFAAPQAVGDLARFGDEIALMGWYGPATLNAQPGETLMFTLMWSPLRPMGKEYWSYGQLLTPEFERIAGDDVEMLRWLYPTSLWRAGDRVPDVHRFTLPRELEPGAYPLVTGVYPTNGAPLSLTQSRYDALGDGAVFGTAKVPQAEEPTPPPEASALDVTIGEHFALTHLHAERLNAEQVRVRLYWRALTHRPEVDATIFVHAITPAGALRTQSDIRPWNGQYPTFIWDADERVMTEHVLNAGADETLNLRVGMYTFPGPTRLELTQAGVSRADSAADLGSLADWLE